MSMNAVSGESPLMRYLPFGFCVMNISICLPLMVADMIAESKNLDVDGLLFGGPAGIVMVVDFPVSFVAFSSGDILDNVSPTFEKSSDLAHGILMIAAFLILGGGQYYFIGRTLRWLIRKRRARRNRPGFPVILIQKDR